MSDNTKMREAFVQACKEYGPTISFGDFEMGWDACIAWQAAQSVPVVGEPVAWVAYTSEGGFRGITLDVKEADRLAALGFYVNPLVHISKDYIPAAELASLREKAAQLETVALSRCADRIKLSRLEQERDELRKDAERYRWLRDSPESPIINIGYATDKIVDAAIAKERQS